MICKCGHTEGAHNPNGWCRVRACPCLKYEEGQPAEYERVTATVLMSGAEEAESVTGWWNGHELVICEQKGVEIPADGEPGSIEGTPGYHNCDQMGCGSMDHVMMRIKIGKLEEPGCEPTPRD